MSVRVWQLPNRQRPGTISYDPDTPRKNRLIPNGPFRRKESVITRRGAQRSLHISPERANACCQCQYGTDQCGGVSKRRGQDGLHRCPNCARAETIAMPAQLCARHLKILERDKELPLHTNYHLKYSEDDDKYEIKPGFSEAHQQDLQITATDNIQESTENEDRDDSDDDRNSVVSLFIGNPFYENVEIGRTNRPSTSPSALNFDFLTIADDQDGQPPAPSALITDKKKVGNAVATILQQGDSEFPDGNSVAGDSFSASSVPDLFTGELNVSNDDDLPEVSIVEDRDDNESLYSINSDKIGDILNDLTGEPDNTLLNESFLVQSDNEEDTPLKIIGTPRSTYSSGDDEVLANAYSAVSNSLEEEMQRENVNPELMEAFAKSPDKKTFDLLLSGAAKESERNKIRELYTLSKPVIRRKVKGQILFPGTPLSSLEGFSNKRSNSRKIPGMFRSLCNDWWAKLILKSGKNRMMTAQQVRTWLDTTCYNNLEARDSSLEIISRKGLFAQFSLEELNKLVNNDGEFLAGAIGDAYGAILSRFYAPGKVTFIGPSYTSLLLSGEPGKSKERVLGFCKFLIRFRATLFDYNKNDEKPVFPMGGKFYNGLVAGVYFRNSHFISYTFKGLDAGPPPKIKLEARDSLNGRYIPEHLEEEPFDIDLKGCANQGTNLCLINSIGNSLNLILEKLGRPTFTGGEEMEEELMNAIWMDVLFAYTGVRVKESLTNRFSLFKSDSHALRVASVIPIGQKWGQAADRFVQCARVVDSNKNYLFIDSHGSWHEPDKYSSQNSKDRLAAFQAIMFNENRRPKIGMEVIICRQDYSAIIGKVMNVTEFPDRFHVATHDNSFYYQYLHISEMAEHDYHRPGTRGGRRAVDSGPPARLKRSQVFSKTRPMVSKYNKHYRGKHGKNGKK